MFMKEPVIEYCPKCDWKSNVVQNTDCFIGVEKECPKCERKTEFRPLNAIEKISNSVYKMFK